MEIGGLWGYPTTIPPGPAYEKAVSGPGRNFGKRFPNRKEQMLAGFGAIGGVKSDMANN